MAKEKFKNFFFVFLDSVFTPPLKIVCQNQRLMSDQKAHLVCFEQMLSVLCKRLKQRSRYCLQSFCSYLFCHTFFVFVFFLTDQQHILRAVVIALSSVVLL